MATLRLSRLLTPSRCPSGAALWQRSHPSQQRRARATIAPNAGELLQQGVGPPEGLLPPSALSGADIAQIPTMRSSELRRLSQAAAAEGAEPELWDALAVRCQASADQLRYWDAVHILQAFTEARVENHPLFLRFADALCSKTSRLAPKHVLDLFAVYEAHGLRPRSLYVELFYAIVRLCRSMYPEEVSLTLQALARYRIGNPTVVQHLVRTVQQELRDFRLLYLCGVAGALGALEACPGALLQQLDERAQFEVHSVRLQELLADLQRFPLLEFSWKPYEDLCLEELNTRSKAVETWEDMDQFADPFEAMCFLQARGLLHEEFLKALCQWCLRGVHQPNVRSERRPTAKQLVRLHDQCRERGLEETVALQDAIAYYVESGGGQWPPALPKPLRYQRKRKYIRSADPLYGLVSLEVPQISSSSSQQANPERRLAALADLPGLPASSPEVWQPSTEEVGTLEVEASEETALQEAEEDQELAASTPHIWYEESPRKPSAPHPDLELSETGVRCRITSRKSPRPRTGRYRKSLLPKSEQQRQPLWKQWDASYLMRKKYRPGYTAPKGLAPGKRG